MPQRRFMAYILHSDPHTTLQVLYSSLVDPVTSQHLNKDEASMGATSLDGRAKANGGSKTFGVKERERVSGKS